MAAGNAPHRLAAIPGLRQISVSAHRGSLGCFSASFASSTGEAALGWGQCVPFEGHLNRCSHANAHDATVPIIESILSVVRVTVREPLVHLVGVPMAGAVYEVLKGLMAGAALAIVHDCPL